MKAPHPKVIKLVQNVLIAVWIRFGLGFITSVTVTAATRSRLKRAALAGARILRLRCAVLLPALAVNTTVKRGYE